VRANYDIFFDDRKIANRHLRPDLRTRMNARAGDYRCGGINWHKFAT